MAYSIGGFFSGAAGLVTTAYTGSGEPRASIGAIATLGSVAAVVLGGVALTGGVGGLVGPVLAAMCLTLIPPIMLGLGWDPNYAEVARGVIIIAVVMVGGLLTYRRRRTGVSAGAVLEQGPPPAPESAPRNRVAQLLVERPVIALTLVFVVLYVATGLQDNSLFTVNGVRSTLLLACPLAIFAASQTLCMLTGGIDLGGDDGQLCRLRRREPERLGHPDGSVAGPPRRAGRGRCQWRVSASSR